MDLAAVTPPRILIIEDEGLVAEDLREMLEGQGYDVVGVAADGTEALRLARAHRPHLMLVDVRLHGSIDGVTTAGLIQQDVHTTAVYLTATADESTLVRARTTEAAGYLLKPFDERGLLAALQIALARHWREVARTEVLDTVVGELAERRVGVVVLDPMLRVVRASGLDDATPARGAELADWMGDDPADTVVLALAESTESVVVSVSGDRHAVVTPLAGVGGAVVVVHPAARPEEGGMVTTCAWCRRIRDDGHGWVAPGDFLHRRHKMSVSHGMCPTCATDWMRGR